MELKQADVNSLKAYPENARTHNDKQVAQIAESIKEFGFCAPCLVDEKGVLIAGHGRLMAAQSLGLKTVPTISIEHLTPAQVKAYRLADNQLALNAGWDFELLGLELGELNEGGFDLDLLGFDESMVADGMEAYGSDSEAKGSLSDKFGIPPFTVLNAREGWWQDRKKAWVHLGLQSELGRDENLMGNSMLATINKGTSLFDPVLAEIAYRWFCPPRGDVLDPFAGGSVRGIVAAKLGRNYVGVDLRKEQVEANRLQETKICNTEPKSVEVKISSKWMRHLFPCFPEYITKECNGRCCEGSNGKTMISLLPHEQRSHEEHGYKVVDGLLQANETTGKCPHKKENGLCGVHGTSEKPFGCIASPFTLNKENTLIIRHRYSRLKCHGCTEGEPAYRTFKSGLELLFGNEETENITRHLDNGGGDMQVAMPYEAYKNLVYLDGIKRKEKRVQESKAGKARWHCGDSQKIDHIVSKKVDFIFSCPPYADLEVYSDDPADLSTMEYGEFKKAYFEIIKRTCKLLKKDRFACFVVGEVRNKKGNYHNFVADTINAFQDAGLNYYNEAILLTAVGTLPLRSGRTFTASRKLGKAHQNVLIFVKGDGKKATEMIGPCEFGDMDAQAN